VADLFPVPIAYFLCVPDLVSAVPGLPETPFLETAPAWPAATPPLFLLSAETVSDDRRKSWFDRLEKNGQPWTVVRLIGTLRHGPELRLDTVRRREPLPIKASSFVVQKASSIPE
jgi:hypothetical protein